MPTNREPQAVRVWGECGVTVQISENPSIFIKATFGHERVAPDDSLATLKRTRKLIDEFNQQVVEEQVEAQTRLAQQIIEDAGRKQAAHRRRLSTEMKNRSARTTGSSSTRTRRQTP